ncbi:MAG: hypothetical protein K8M05_12270 [Deltaproteobacteria bacterium]|nr:hypothetical protein [Kofleriaceae bacterium]
MRSFARRSALLVAIAGLSLVLAPSTVAAQSGPRAQYQVGGEAYAGQPFLLAIVVEGLAEQPQPTAPAITVPGAAVTPMGVELRAPATVIVNGRRVDQGSGTWILRYRMEVPKGGTYALPDVKVAQAGTQVAVKGARLQVRELPRTRDMAIEVLLPQRPVYVGETIPVDIAWLLRKDPRNQELSVPLLALADSLTVTVPPPANPRQVVSLPAGGRDLDLGYTQDTIERGGVEYTRLLFRVLVTPLRAGPIAIPPAQVVAELEVGMGRDAFGFPAPRTERFRATDEARTLDVRPLPETGKPASFGGAVGSSFSMAVRASRSVVQLGEPVELEITVKSDQRLDTVGLPPLDGPGMLPRDKFVVPADPPVGELSSDGLAKTFRVPVQVVGADATAIPALAFSYFDPVRAAYQTIHSEPIALSVKGGSVVGAAGFAAMVLLLVPWGGRRRPWMVAVALAPAITWVAMTVSLVVEDHHTSDAVVMQASILRTADSAGAPPRLASQLPAGVEVVIVERRDAWTQIRLPSGTTGWLPAAAVERVHL